MISLVRNLCEVLACTRRVPHSGDYSVFGVFRKRPKLAVLTADYVNGPSSELEAAFQGRSWSMRLTGWSAMRVSTSRK